MPAPPTQPAQLLQANVTFFSGKVKRMHAWILHEEKEANIFSWTLMSKLYPVTLRWHGRPSAEVNENINLGYSQDQGYS